MSDGIQRHIRADNANVRQTDVTYSGEWATIMQIRGLGSMNLWNLNQLNDQPSYAQQLLGKHTLRTRRLHMVAHSLDPC